MAEKHLLVIDDEIFARRILETALQRLGYRVTLAATAAEGLACLQAGSFDGVTCDLMMPFETGLDFLRKVKALPALQAVPVIIISAAGQKESLEQALQLGAAAFLSKPFSESQLRLVLEQTLPV